MRLSTKWDSQCLDGIASALRDTVSDAVKESAVEDTVMDAVHDVKDHLSSTRRGNWRCATLALHTPEEHDDNERHGTIYIMVYGLYMLSGCMAC